jgi:hypothetical protein
MKYAQPILMSVNRYKLLNNLEESSDSSSESNEYKVCGYVKPACGAEKKKSREHKVLLLGDSQVRGCAVLLNQNLNNKFRVSGFVKSGAKTSDILDTNIDTDMSKDDVIVVCAGTNDISENSAKEGLRN